MALAIGYYRASIFVSDEFDSPLAVTQALMSSQMVVTENDGRKIALVAWLATLAEFQFDLDWVEPASSDASFRRYFRVPSATHGSLIVMDAPPELEDCRPFISVAALLESADVSVPKILAFNLDEGFLLLSDLGSETYLGSLLANDRQDAPRLMGDALSTLLRIQSRGDATKLVSYDRAMLLREMTLFIDWYLSRHCGTDPSAAERDMLSTLFEHLVENAQVQAQILVHRDYHSRNLMVLENAVRHGNPGVIDFQDAVAGPITYDLVSLLRDAYIEWPEEQVLDWTVRYWQKARAFGLEVPADFADFWRGFELMGLQRHLKVLGIFARLSHRDGKHGYLNDLPLVLRYVRGVAARYRVAGPLLKLLDRAAGHARATGYTF
jgi:aminoglycoside/choline kinase family phosphotransferase